MQSYAEKKQNNKYRDVADGFLTRQQRDKSTQEFVDNRPEAVSQRQFTDTINTSPRQNAQRKQLDAISDSPAQLQTNAAADVLQRAGLDDEELLQGKFSALPVQRKLDGKPNNTGLPDKLKAGIESLSGFSMNDVSVHFNSPKPAQLQAHAYAQGSNIYLASGQEKHLPHEAWHVVQQKQGRVKPTLQMQGRVNVNDDAALENEADVMGARAAIQRVYNSNESLHVLQQKQNGESSTQQFYNHFNTQAALNLAGPAGFGQDAVSCKSMSNQAYQDWRETAQCKMGMHGACSFGDRTIVTQFHNPAYVMQMVGLPQKVKAFLVIGEGLLTVVAGTAAAILSGGVAAIPGIIAAAIGIVKIVRGCLMLKEDPSDATKVVIDALRMVEAAAAIVGGAIAGNPAVLIFGVAKAIRALLTAITDWMGTETAHPMIRKALMSMATLAHSVEVVALGFSGGSAIAGASDAAEIAGGVIVAGVAASKGVRAVDQGIGAYKAKTGKETSTGWQAPDVDPNRGQVRYVPEGD